MGTGHDVVRPRCGEVDTMGGGHNGGGHDDETSRGAYAGRQGGEILLAWSRVRSRGFGMIRN